MRQVPSQLDSNLTMQYFISKSSIGLITWTFTGILRGSQWFLMKKIDYGGFSQNLSALIETMENHTMLNFARTFANTHPTSGRKQNFINSENPHLRVILTLVDQSWQEAYNRRQNYWEFSRKLWNVLIL